MKDGLAFYCRPCTQQMQRDNYRKRLERKKLRPQYEGSVQLITHVWDRWQRDLSSAQPKTREAAELSMRQASRRPLSSPILSLTAIVSGMEPDEVAQAMFTRMIRRQKSADKERRERKGSTSKGREEQVA